MEKFQRYLSIALILCSGLHATLEFSLSGQSGEKEDESKLRFVNVVFRHGDRTPDEIGDIYPNDPYKDDDYYPMGKGQLTNVGKTRAYQLGQTLRGMYDSFLGDVYYQPNIYARSSSMVRTKMSLQLVLAALYPPTSTQKWNMKLLWQPTDFEYAPTTEDAVLLPLFCNKFKKAYSALLQTPAMKQEREKHDDIIKQLSVFTGHNITDLFDIFTVYHTLTTQLSIGLSLPKWMQGPFSNELMNVAILQYNLFSYNNNLKRRNGGILLRKIIDDMNKVINGTLKDRKINLFSGHDVNVASLINALNMTVSHIPQYTSSLILELREKNDKYYVKVLHYYGIPPLLKELEIPGCEVLCPYKKFIRLTKASTAKGENFSCRSPIIIDSIK